MQIDEYMGYEYNPKTFIDELIFYDQIHDEYFKSIEELIEREGSNFTSEMHLPDNWKSNPESEPIEITRYRQFFDFESGEIDFFKKKFPSLLRGASIITVYSIFEYNLKIISDEFFRLAKLNLSFNDLQGHNALERFQRVFRILNNSLSYDNKRYELNAKIFCNQNCRDIKQIQKIRNCFAHSNGILGNEKTQDMKNTIASIQNNSASYFKIKDNLILIENGAIHFISQLMRNFIKEILK
ncbi:hypothetical protein Lsan_2485 [Legionella santicrucis]|uniref:RiboL-PSP-HEPN domain-containing protein n=1 Tax=Legionella santicrucis TaxID=45074 RepID=A0A0W0YLU0_9GAMM|nr:hypothetical protein [Legionella santicrucis]KTD57856.1 hypothetical protein Lsan_2485 [Legionella santicrucis]